MVSQLFGIFFTSGTSAKNYRVIFVILHNYSRLFMVTILLTLGATFRHFFMYIHKTCHNFVPKSCVSTHSTQKMSVTNFLVFCQKSEHYDAKVKKVKFLFHFITHFWLLDIYKCPKSFCEFQIEKKVW